MYVMQGGWLIHTHKHTHKHGSEPAENVGHQPIVSTIHYSSIFSELPCGHNSQVRAWSGLHTETADDNSSNKHDDGELPVSFVIL